MSCPYCGQSSVAEDPLLGLQVSLSDTRVLYAPYDLSQPIQRLSLLPEGAALLIGRTHSGKTRIVHADSPEFSEIAAFELPEVEDKCEFALIRLANQKVPALRTPILLQVPLSVDVSPGHLTDLVTQRLKPLGATIRVVSDPPAQFTLRKAGPLSIVNKCLP
jgi:hypothetical protein